MNALDKDKLIKELYKVTTVSYPSDVCDATIMINTGANMAYNMLLVEILMGKFDLEEKND
jgi:hypothetical protein